MKKSLFLTAALALALAACSPPAAAPPPAPTSTSAPAPAAPSIEGIPAGDYVSEKAHASLVFRISHMGYSHFTGRFATWEARLHLDPAHPETATVVATIDPRSLESDNPPAGFLNDLRTSAQWLDAPHFPQMTFRSTSVVLTGPASATITGDLTLHGVTKPVTLEAAFNGGYAGMQYDPNARVGFSAHGVLKRSDFGLSYAILPPNSNMGVGDEIDIVIEAEFTGPAWHGPVSGGASAPAAPQH